MPYLNLAAVKERAGKPSTSTIYRWMPDLFPQNVKLGPNKVAWREEDIAEWEKDPEAWREKHGAAAA